MEQHLLQNSPATTTNNMLHSIHQTILQQHGDAKIKFDSYLAPRKNYTYQERDHCMALTVSQYQISLQQALIDVFLSSSMVAMNQYNDNEPTKRLVETFIEVTHYSKTPCGPEGEVREQMRRIYKKRWQSLFEDYGSGKIGMDEMIHFFFTLDTFIRRLAL